MLPLSQALSELSARQFLPLAHRIAGIQGCDWRWAMSFALAILTLVWHAGVNWTIGSSWMETAQSWELPQHFSHRQGEAATKCSKVGAGGGRSVISDVRYQRRATKAGDSEPVYLSTFSALKFWETARRKGRELWADADGFLLLVWNDLTLVLLSNLSELWKCRNWSEISQTGKCWKVLEHRSVYEDLGAYWKADKAAPDLA